MSKKTIKRLSVKLAPSFPATEFSPEFVELMANRMEQSFYKYGKVEDAKKVDEIASLKERLRKYEVTGNTEWLVDVANFAMIEFMFPKHKEAHFEATNSTASPGLKRFGETQFSSRPHSEI